MKIFLLVLLLVLIQKTPIYANSEYTHGNGFVIGPNGEVVGELDRSGYRGPSGEQYYYNKDGELIGDTISGYYEDTNGEQRNMGARLPTSTEGTTPSESSGKMTKQQYADCKTAHSSAINRCEKLDYTQQGSQLLNQFAQVKSAGNIKEACGLAKQISALSVGANAGFAYSCQSAAKSCETACDPNNGLKPTGEKGPFVQEMYSACQRLKRNAIAGYIQAGADAANFAISAQCEKAADAKCVGQNAVNDPDCVQFCSQPGRESHPKCALAGANCQNPTFAQQNAQFCQCLQNPFGPNCSTAQFPTRPGNNGNDPLAGIRTNVGGLADGENDFLGNDSRGGSNSGGGGPNGGGSGFNGGAGASSPIAGDGSGEGNGDEPLNKEILTGSGGGSGGAGGFFGYGSGGGEGSAGGGGRGGSGSGDGGSGIDLRAFLPGGKNDPRRGPASLEEASGITKSDGLTNFQKVTRKINQKLVEGDLNP